VQGYDFEGYERTIDVHVKNLRASSARPHRSGWSSPVPGVGYKLGWSAMRSLFSGRYTRRLAARVRRDRDRRVRC